MKRAALYVRVSTDEQSTNGASLEVQEARCRAYAKAQGWKVVEVLRDQSSGKNLERPGVRRLLELIDGQRVQCAVVYRLDRLSRRVGDLSDLLERFEKAGIALASVSEAFDTSTPAGRLVVNILGSVGQWEREAIVARVRDALRHRKSNGLVYGVIPFGFHRQGKRLIEDPAEQKIIRRIFRERAKGQTLGAIAEALNRDRVRTKQGGKWWASTISAVLKNDLHTRREATA